ncbi:unnamed protein product, partial [Closterium sp. NIES-53]
VLHSDGGGDFRNSTLKAFYSTEGILQTFTLPDSPQQNGVAESRNRILVQIARCILTHASAPPLWGYAMLHAAALHNLHTHPHHTHTTPAKLWTGQKPSIRPLRVWGCTSDSHPFYPSSKASPSPLPPSLTWADIDRLPPRATPSPPLPATSTVSDPPPPASPSSTTLSPPLLPSPSPPPPAPPLSSPPTLAPAPAITPPSTPPPLKTYHRRPPAPTPPSPAPSPDPALAPTPNSPTATPPAPPPSPIVSRTRSHKAPKPLSLSVRSGVITLSCPSSLKTDMRG